jgi:hypothetical protein
MGIQNLTAGSPCPRSPRKKNSESAMDSNNYAMSSRDDFLENFGAELTQAAYPLMLQHGAIDNWLTLELELWKALREIVKKWDQEWPSAGVMLLASDDARTSQVDRRWSGGQL